MNFTQVELNTMRNALTDLRNNLDDSGPCDHDVNVCVCGLKATYENLADLFHRMTNGEVGFPLPPEPTFDMVSFATDLLTQHNVFRIAQLKAEADARNASFRKGTINEND